MTNKEKAIARLTYFIENYDFRYEIQSLARDVVYEQAQSLDKEYGLKPEDWYDEICPDLHARLLRRIGEMYHVKEQ